MSPSDIKLALHEVLANGVSLNATAYIVLILGWIVAGALGAFLGAFFGKRGETAGVKRDIETIKDNLRHTTEATEEIKAQITGELWERQNRLTFKKDVYIRLLTGLGDASSALRQLLFCDARINDPALQNRRAELTQLMDAQFGELRKAMVEIRRMALVTPLVCGDAVSSALGKLVDRWLQAEDATTPTEYLKGCHAALKEAVATVTGAGREDMKLFDQRKER
jgi:hypothetical protein